MSLFAEWERTMVERWPCTDEFDPEELASTLRNRGGVTTIVYKGIRYGWIGNRGSLMYAPAGTKKAYLACAAVHGEDGAKVWSWLQGWIVRQTSSYIELFTEELKDGADDDVSGSEETTVQSTGDWDGESSGEDVEDTLGELPF